MPMAQHLIVAKTPNAAPTANVMVAPIILNAHATVLFPILNANATMLFPIPTVNATALLPTIAAAILTKGNRLGLWTKIGQ